MELECPVGIFWVARRWICVFSPLALLSQAVCAEVSAELKASVDTYTHDMDVGVLVYELLLTHPQASRPGEGDLGSRT